MTPTPKLLFHLRLPRLVVASLLSLILLPSLWPQDESGDEEEEENEAPEAFELSPFEVTSTEDDIGYYASNTLAGSRLNTNVSDLAASITVVTKQQMEDTGVTSFNEVFLYEANTQGAFNYTPVELNRGGLKDHIGGSATNGATANTAVTANSIRGLGSPDFAWNYYPSIARIPADIYNVSSIEINRGPNSLLFGLGSPAGIVNQTVGYATLDTDFSEVTLRAGTNGIRGSFSVNQSLRDDTLALYAAALYEKKDFEREPSYDISRRQTLGATWTPFEGTTIKAFFENYNNSRRWPNALLPRDGITPWLEAGRPVWNPLTQEVTILDTGEVRGPFGLDSVAGDFTGDSVITDPDSPQYIPGIGFPSYNRPPVMRIQADGSWDWYSRRAIHRVPDGISDHPILDRRLTQSALPPQPDNFFSTWTAPSLTNKDLYNWEEINIQAPNFGEFEAQTYNIELEQRIMEDLYLSAGWFRQDYEAFEYYPLAQQAPITVRIDTNIYNIDGTENENYLKPYIEDYQQDLVTAPQTNEVARAMLAYNLDFTDNDGIVRWAGRHRLLGLYQWQEKYVHYNRHRMAFVEPTDSPWVPDVKPENFSYAYDTSSIPRNFYLGEGEGEITSAPFAQWGVPGYGGPTSGTITSYYWDEMAFQNETASFEHVWFDAGNGVGVQHSKIESFAGVLQSYFWDDRIVTVVGARKDKWKARSNTTGPIEAFGLPGLERSELYPVSNDYRLANIGELKNRFFPYEEIEGTTTTAGIVFKPIEWLSVHYNTSENFNPPDSQAFSIFGEELPKPAGEGEDYGISVNLFENKLIARLNFFETSSNFQRASQAGLLLDRTVRVDSANFRGWAETVVRIQDGLDVSDPNYDSDNLPPLSDAQQARVEELTGLPYTWPDFPIASTQTTVAEGYEFELIYNPMRNWNIKFVFAHLDTTNTNVMPEYEAWIDTRMPVWTSAAAPDLQSEYTLNSGSTIKVDTFWEGYGFGEIPNHPNPTDFNQTAQGFYENVVEAIVAEARQLEGATPFGVREWHANLITNYRFTEGALENFSIGGAVRMEGKAVVGYHGLVNEEGQFYRTDASRPIYDTDVGADRWDDLTHIDLWLTYDFTLMDGDVDASVQLNVRDLFAETDLLPIYANWDGSVANYRITRPRQIFLTTRFRF